MRWTPVFATALLVAGFVPVAQAQLLPECTPIDEAHLTVATYHLRMFTGDVTQMQYEVWKETNGIVGLQSSSTAACGASTDSSTFSTCAGTKCSLMLA